MKRLDYISWQEFFMGVAIIAAERSKDPITNVGAVLVKDNIIIGTGYNGFPNGCSDDEFPWNKNSLFLYSKHTYVVHAEPNAILNSSCPAKGSTLYVTLHPCNECAKIIIQAGVDKIVFLNNKHSDSTNAAKIMFYKAGIKTVKYCGRVPKIKF